ncbi:hypothetical protein F5Y12DRAFT_717870 [Xylaria sp. FL1777]|nr:hypothetical protein F5Y12DRAFT_717870 [Xylaria sp. FL1777]
MENDDTAIALVLLVTLYTFPVIYGTVRIVSNYLQSGMNIKRQGLWAKDGDASGMEGTSLLIFYIFSITPLIVYTYYCARSPHKRRVPDDEIHTRGRRTTRSERTSTRNTKGRPRRPVSPSKKSEPPSCRTSRWERDQAVEKWLSMITSPTPQSEIQRRQGLDLSYVEVDQVHLKMENETVEHESS